MKALLKNTDARRNKFNDQFQKSLKYYFNQNDITNRNNGESKLNNEGKDEILRRADNRVSSNYHQLLVDQEAGYVATIPPDIDVEDDKLNDIIRDTLGDNFNLRMNQLVVDASNAGVGWIHFWFDADNQFRYGIVPPDQVTPIYSSDLNRKLLAVRRTYSQLDPDTGKNYKIHEYWTDKDVTVFKSQLPDYADLAPLNDYFVTRDLTTDDVVGTGNYMAHQFSRVPFIPFSKNKYERPEINKYKGLIDVYDDVYNGFVNDIDDVQQVILILTNYGGTDLQQFMSDLKKFKAIKMDSTDIGDRSGVDKLNIDVPVEARNSLLDITKGDIFVHGQGIDPTKFEVNNATGTAIKMLYSHLELKASVTEAYFRDGLNDLVRAILRWLKAADADGRKINQTWTRTAIQNNLEQAQVVAQLAQYSSDEAIAKANPIVDDWQQELEDRQNDIVKRDGYDNPDALKDVNGGEPDDEET
ncbi:phage portal protein [Agrilactobacillus composti DSM 18527 = JCM 14202]|uniref:Phage portal protein n=2 Tax=Agrilactobacillus TaxID=2767875 RepID=X0PUQ2_9LACO|nr:phage portal protein [Agrilactobacillus composti DSM 18527 = JCM 14202]GAF41136.1 phage portal protein [Agrilactobacillus composti DSM 18527 = JCM 14202]